MVFLWITSQPSIIMRLPKPASDVMEFKFAIQYVYIVRKHNTNMTEMTISVVYQNAIASKANDHSSKLPH